MKVMMALTIMSFVLLGTTNVTPATSVSKKKVEKYTCVFDASTPFPDGSTGIAEVGVKETGNGNNFVTVSYYSDNYNDYLGQYSESNVDILPSTHQEACQFAFDHFGERE